MSPKWGATAKYYSSHTKTMLPMRKSVPRASRQLDHMKISWRSQRDANCSGMVMFPVHQAGQNHLARHSERGKKTRRTKEEVGRQHQGMDRPGVPQVPEGSGEPGKLEKTGCMIICGAQMTLMVKGLMMMMNLCYCQCLCEHVHFFFFLNHYCFAVLSVLCESLTLLAMILCVCLHRVLF